MTRLLPALGRGLRRRPVLLVNAFLLVLVGTAGVWRGTNLTRPSAAAPADLFMQSIASEDGDLGWSQLCPDLQQEMSRETLEQLTATQRAVASQRGMTMTVEHVADRPRPDGGQIRFYVARVHAADGATGDKTYVINTGATGCVESIH
ncbi:MAG: hypothetical protein JOZ81_21780 [Chloroflexi bacterium]|nr:hypothetical protein [Chloroflexota bacterium]